MSLINDRRTFMDTAPTRPRLTRRELLRTAGIAGGAALVGAHLWSDAHAALPLCAVTIAEQGDARLIFSNGVPDHATGVSPNPGCPMPTRAQRHVYRVPLAPTPAASLTPIGYWEFGVALNGVPFDPSGPWLDGDPASGWHFEV